MAGSRRARTNNRSGQPAVAPEQQTFSFIAPQGTIDSVAPDAAFSPGTPSQLSFFGEERPRTGSGGRPSAMELDWPLDEGILGARGGTAAAGYGGSGSGDSAAVAGDGYLASLQAAASLEELERVAVTCQRCQLRAGCRGVVFGEGDPHALVMFVGEGPGQTEDELGRPFVGRAGQLLDRWIALLGLQRRQVYITNVVKCRPPGNRTPTAEEARMCWPILRRQLALIRPRLLVCLGSPAVQALVHPSARITRMRGSWVERGEMKLIGTFHPAAVLRDETKHRAVLEDLRKLRAEYQRLTSSTSFPERDA